MLHPRRSLRGAACFGYSGTLFHMQLDVFWLDVLRDRAGEAAANWVTDAAAAAAAGGSADALCAAYTAAPKHVGQAHLVLTHREEQALAAVVPQFSVAHWTMDDAARCALLTAVAARMDPDAFVAAAAECFERGDAREQQSWLRAVSAFPLCERFTPLVIDACRTNILPVFEAVACENPFPARYFPDPNFNQLVLKALFNNVGLSRIVGLSMRGNAELARMAADYAAERRAAGRTVPMDIELAIEDTVPEDFRR